jgi:hypothetical protein
MKYLIPSILLIFIASSCGTLSHNRIKFSKVENTTNVDLQSDSKIVKKLMNPELDIASVIDNSGLNTVNIQKVQYTLAELNKSPTIISSGIEDITSDQQCDKILLRNGDEISGKVIEIGTQEIKYKKCDNLEGPTISILKSSVFMITYANGTKDVFKEESTITNQSNNNQNIASSNLEAHPLAIGSFILGLLGFLPLLGAILGVIALDKIKANPEKYKGKGLAIAGIILSVICFVVLITLLL